MYLSQAWRVPSQGRNHVANRYNRQGIFVKHSSRAFRDEEGKNFWVEIEIIDEYRYPSGLQAPYNVTVSCSFLPERIGWSLSLLCTCLYETHSVRFDSPSITQTTLLVPGNYQGERRIKINQIFNRPGKYRIKLPTVSVRTTGSVVVEMVDKNGLYFSDDFSLTFHMYYYRLLKWLLVLPMMGMFGVLVILRPQEAMPLPSFSRNTD